MSTNAILRFIRPEVKGTLKHRYSTLWAAHAKNQKRKFFQLFALNDLGCFQTSSYFPWQNVKDACCLDTIAASYILRKFVLQILHN